jgi:ech hydrogenase subunit B
MDWKALVIVIVYVLFAPLVGGFLDGVDRKISARMQGRKGPSILQPFYDVEKLFQKEALVVKRSQTFLVMTYLLFMIIAGSLFYAGMDLLLCFFALTTCAMFLVLAASFTHSPYASVGCQRELVQMMAYEPMVLLTAVGFYVATGTFYVKDIVYMDTSAILYLPGVFVGFLFILTIKMRKSPFDLSTAHHAHQEVVRGVTQEMVGSNLALITLAEWYEVVFLLGVIALFIINSNPISYVVALVVVLATYFLEILIDNVSARVNWKVLLVSTWVVTLIAGGINLTILVLMK